MNEMRMVMNEQESLSVQTLVRNAHVEGSVPDRVYVLEDGWCTHAGLAEFKQHKRIAGVLAEHYKQSG